MKRHTLVFAFLLALLVAACGGGQEDTTEGSGTGAGDAASEAAAGDAESPAATEEAAAEQVATLDCRSIEFIVPYSPGGGSDRQVRRLQPLLEESLDASINVVYQTGGDGAVGWQALDAAEPDGCTASNVVAPNIILLSMTGEDVGFQADEFSYVAWTETTPNVIAVSVDSEIESIEDFVQQATDNPGEITVGGVGEVGELLVSQVIEATGIDITYVPVTGGVGDIVPQLQGGHIDAGIFGASHVLEHADSLRGLAISGTEPSAVLPDTPTFAGGGYDGVTLTTSWGVMLPPGVPDGIIQTWNDAVTEAVADEEITAELEDQALTPLDQTPEEAVSYLEEQREGVEAAQAE